jgi:hypothetical protein
MAQRWHESEGGDKSDNIRLNGVGVKLSKQINVSLVPRPFNYKYKI